MIIRTLLLSHSLYHSVFPNPLTSCRPQSHLPPTHLTSSLLFQSPSLCPTLHVSLFFYRWFVSIDHVSCCLLPHWQTLGVASLTSSSSSSTSSWPCFLLIPLPSDHSAVLRSIIHPSFPPWWVRLGGEFEFHRKSLEIWFGFCLVCGEGEFGFLFLSVSLFIVCVSVSWIFFLCVIKYMLPFKPRAENKHQTKIFGFAISHCAFWIDFSSDFWPYLNYTRYVFTTTMLHQSLSPWRLHFFSLMLY